MNVKTCSEPGCPGKVVAKGLCGMHYKRQIRHGDTTTVLVRTKMPLDARPKCNTFGCTNIATRRGICQTCLQRKRRLEGLCYQCGAPTNGNGCYCKPCGDYRNAKRRKNRKEDQYARH